MDEILIIGQCRWGSFLPFFSKHARRTTKRIRSGGRGWLGDRVSLIKSFSTTSKAFLKAFLLFGVFFKRSTNSLCLSSEIKNCCFLPAGLKVRLTDCLLQFPCLSESRTWPRLFDLQGIFLNIVLLTPGSFFHPLDSPQTTTIF